MIARCFDQGVDADSQNKNNVSQNCLVHSRNSYARQSVPETIRETAVPRTAECEKGAADRADYRSRWSDCQLTADALRLQNIVCVPKSILVQRKRAPESVDGKVVDENALSQGQGYLPKLVTKMNEMPTTFESSVVK